MNKILVPTDFSKESEYALKTAAKLAKKHDLEIVVLHMLDIPETFLTKDDSKEYPELLIFTKLAKKRFSTFLDKQYLDGVIVKEAIQHHRTFEGIIKSAKKEEADVIIMGSRGTSGIQEILIGSNTEKVVRTSDIPVLVIKDQQENLGFNDFVFASNFIDDCFEAFKRARKFALQFNMSIKLLYINTPGRNFKSSEEIEMKISYFLNKLKITPTEVLYSVYNDYDVESGILNFCNKNNVDLIGVPTHGRKGIAQMFKGSIGKDVANHAQIPVITFKI